jgi:hypothetical protein
MAPEPLSPYARKTWALLVILGLTIAGFLLATHPQVGLVSAIILGVTLVFLLEPASGRKPQPRDARLLARQARWEAGWEPAPRAVAGADTLGKPAGSLLPAPGSPSLVPAAAPAPLTTGPRTRGVVHE